MDVVLGLSMTSAAVRWVLVEGSTGEGATIDHEVLDIATVREASSASAYDLVEAVFGRAVQDTRLAGIGVTWTSDVAVEASIVLEALATEGFLDAVPVWEEEAATALATGIKDLANYEDIALCIVEPDSALVAIASPQGVLVDRIDRPLGPGAAAVVAERAIARLDVDDWIPEIIYTVGSADDLHVVVAMLREAAGIPVISAAEPGLALARGAALASARTSGIEAWDALAPSLDAYAVDFGKSTSRPVRLFSTSKSRALTSVLIAAALTFVVSLSIALSLRLIPSGSDTPDQQTLAGAAGEKAVAAPAARPPAPEATREVPEATREVPEATREVPEATREVPEAPAPTREAPPPAPESVGAEEAVPEQPAAVPDAPPPVYGPLDPAPAAPAPVAPVPAGVYVPPPPDYIPPAPFPQQVPGGPLPPPVSSPQQLPGFDQPPPQPRLRDRIIERIPILNRFHEPQYPTP